MIIIKEGLYWVGIVDWNLRTFHGHQLSTPQGSSYNSFLIKDEKIALVDTVWGPFAGEFIANLAQNIDLNKIDYIVMNHNEPDHSGALPALMAKIPDTTIITSPKGKETLQELYHQNWNFKVVQTGDVLSLGRRELQFIEAPMLHWPDTMFTYLTKDNVLMCNDAFGMHLASASLFDDESNIKQVLQEAAKYFANILTPFSKQVVRKLDELMALELPLDIIAPSHGILWRSHIDKIIELYYRWARGQSHDRIIIFYDSMWEATSKMAHAMAKGLRASGIDYKIVNLAVSDCNDVITEAFLARGILVGSPTFNRGYLPTIAPFVAEIKGLGLQKKVAAVFGSYGWSGEAVGLLEDQLEESGIKILQEGLRCKFQPSEEELKDCQEFARRFAHKFKEE